MARDSEGAREQRRVQRARWPIVRYRLGEEPSDDLSEVTTPVERIAMMWTLAQAAWKVAGRPLPSYDRRNLPGRLFRAGTSRPPTMTLEGLNEDFRDLLVLLADAGVEFVIVGAHALAFHGAPRASAADFAQPGSVYQIGLPPRRIDLLTEISGVTFDEAWASRTTAELEGRTVAFIGREALIKYKEASGRLKDVADVARLRKTHPTQEGYPASGRTPCAYVGFRLTAFGASDDGELAASRGWPSSG